MRTLTIRRNKSFTGCLVKLKVYVEDPVSGDTTINQTLCRKLGTLKNGEEQSFQISEEAVKIFVIADKVSKDLCNDFYQLQAGQEPVSLSGGCKFNPAVGNAFLFDNNYNINAMANRKRNKKSGIWVLVIAAIIGAAIGFAKGAGVFEGDPEPKTFTAQEMQITLTDEFRETEYEGYDACYDSREVAVMVVREAFEDYPEFADCTVEEYGDLLIEVNELDCETLTDGNRCYFAYDSMGTDNKTEYHYVARLYKSNEAFWMIQFAVDHKKFEEFKPLFDQWGDSVSFAS